MKGRSATYCEDCDHVAEHTRKRNPASWLCLRFPRLEGGGFVAPTVWADQEPYMRCVHINGGDCPLFEPIPDPENDSSRARVHRSDYEQPRQAIAVAEAEPKRTVK